MSNLHVYTNSAEANSHLRILALLTKPARMTATVSPLTEVTVAGHHSPASDLRAHTLLPTCKSDTLMLWRAARSSTVFDAREAPWH